MSENRRRFRNKKRDEARSGPSPTVPVTIARREDSRINTPVMQPKILLKKELDSTAASMSMTTAGGSGSSSSNNDMPPASAAIKTIIIHRSCERGAATGLGLGSGAAGNLLLSTTAMPAATTICAALGSSKEQGLALSKEKTNGEKREAAGLAAAVAGQDLSQPPRMTRPTPLLLSNGVFNANARKLFHKSNTDFTVIGVLGGQAVGKSTLLNLLAAEHDDDYDYYKHLFGLEADECIFANRHRNKSNSSAKQVLRPRTEGMQFFITRERYVLLDTPPMLAGSTAKDADHLDLQTLSSIMQLLSCCHVLLLVIDELGLEKLRLLHAALRLRSRLPCKGYISDYLPQLIFVRQRAQRRHFEAACRERLDKQLAILFDGTQLPIYRGSSSSSSTSSCRVINSFLLPELCSNAATAYHASLPDLVRQFRERVLSSVRRLPMMANNDFTELLWFELLADLHRKSNTQSQHFEKIYAEIKLRHLELRSKWHPDSNWRNES